MNSILTIVTGQSNCNRTFQNEVSRIASKKSIVHTSYFGGEPMSNWVSGTSPSYSRGANYTAMISKCTGLRPYRVVLVIMQGENDTVNQATAALWTGKVDAMIEFLKTDFETTDVKVVVGKPWPQSTELPPNIGYTTLRSSIDTWVAANTNNRASFETSDLTRPPGNVHFTEWTALNVPGASLTAAERAMESAANFYMI